MLEGMHVPIRRDRFSLAFDSLRWLFIAIPLASSAPTLDRWTWALAVLAMVASIPMLWLPTRPTWLLPAGMIVLAAAGGALWVLKPVGFASVVVYCTVFYVARFLSLRSAIPVAVIVAASLTAMFLRYGIGLRAALLEIALVSVVTLLGVNRRSRASRLEQTQLALARARTAAEEHARAAALTERARIARELHDVLAHSLSGLALNLQGTRLMLRRDGAGEDVVAQVERAQRLAVDGLAEARKAVAALREDPVSLEREIADLLAGYRLDTGATAELSVHGTSRTVDTASGTTALRTVQEALSNTRKHAPGASVRVVLAFTTDRIEVTVLDSQGRRPAPSGPAGYGLRGMRERAELLGGRLSTGPAEDGWRVHLAVPA
jgi:signal transduction histidine kinase